MALGVISNGSAVLSKVDQLDFIDVKRWAANLGAYSLFGQGIIVNSEKTEVKKFLQDTLNANKFDDLMIAIAEEVNYWGRVVLTIDKTKNGNFIFSYATPELFQNVAKIEITPFYAKLLKRKVVGMQVFFIEEVWTDTDVKRSIEVKDQFNQVSSYNKDTHGSLPKDLQVPAYEKHNLGFVPFIEITNKPNRNLMLGAIQDYSVLADDFPVRNMPLHINNGLRQMFKEEILGKSRMAGQIPISTIKKAGSVEKLMLADAYIETDQTGNNTPPVAVMASSYDGMKWLEPQKQKINLYFKGCGYSEVFPSENAQTEAETLYSKDNTQRTNKAKRRRYTELLNELFSKLLVYKGLMTSLDDEKPFTLEIKENVVYNQLQLVEFLKSAMEGSMPLMTHEEAIMLQRDLDDTEQAEELSKQLKEQADEQMQKEADMFNDATNDVGGMGKAGAGGDPDTSKEGL